MPKIIENVEEKISRSVILLIREHGYSQVNMRMIAKQSGISVGTLYNYYKDKEALTTTVIYRSWLGTVECLDKMMKQPLSCEEKLNRFVEILYTEVTKRKGIGYELIKHSVYPKEKFQEIKMKIKEHFMTLTGESLEELDKSLTQAYRERAFETIMLTVVNLVHEFENQKEDNLFYLKDMTRKLL